MEEAVHLLRSVPRANLLPYYVGSVPFVVAALFFLADMSRNPFAEQRAATGSLALALLFLWMKVWHAVFAQGLMTQLVGETDARWGWRRVLRVTMAQTILQPSGLFLIPLAMLAMLPFAHCYAFYQNVSTLGNGDGKNLKELVRTSWEQACAAPMQSNTVLGLISLFSFFVFMDLAVALAVLPYLLETLLGVETAFMKSGPASILNTTFLAVVSGLSYLCLDPLLKAIYVLRCFYGDATGTGADLRVELRLAAAQRRWKAIGLLGVLGIVSAPRILATTAADHGTTPVAELDQNISEVLDQPRYTWRMPRDWRPDEEEEKGVFATFIASVIDTLEAWFKKLQAWGRRISDWLSEHLRRKHSESDASGASAWLEWFRIVVYVALAILFIALALSIWRAWKQRPRLEFVTPEAAPGKPDITSEDVVADELPSDEWLHMADDLAAKGELRLALRALYLATLALLAQRELLALARHKSNRDYVTELRRRSHALPELFEIFHGAVRIFDGAWYGTHNVTADGLTAFRGSFERIRAGAEEGTT